MTLNYDSLQALIQKKYVPVLYDLIFTTKDYLTAQLKDKAKSYKERKIVVPLEYGESANVQATSPYQVLQLAPVDPFTAAEYAPKMVTGTLTISKEEELVMNSDGAVKNIIDAKMKNLQKSIEKFFVTRLWSRSLLAADNKQWNSMLDLVNAEETAVGGIPASGIMPAWWKSKMLNNASFTGDTTAVADLIDVTKDTYLFKMLQRGIAKAKYQTGEKPSIIVVPQYIWDLIEFIMDQRKTGSKMSEKAAKMGFTALNFRDIDIIASDNMVEAQTGDTDGKMYFLNLDYLYMFFNPGAKFTIGKFIESSIQNSKTAKVWAYGNFVTTNRGAQCNISQLASPKTYGA